MLIFQGLGSLEFPNTQIWGLASFKKLQGLVLRTLQARWFFGVLELCAHESPQSES